MSIDIKDFLEDCRSRNLTNKTIATYKSNVTEYLRFVENPLNVDTLKLRNFLDYLKNDIEYRIGKVAKKGVCPKTLNAYFSAIRTYYDYLVYTRQLDNNPVLPFRQRYLSRIKEQHNGENTRQLISIEDMIQLVTLDMAILDRAILMILAKTGVRRGELIAIDREDLDLEKKEIILKPKAKRTNRLVFFDDETTLVLRAYLEWRDKRTKMKALFISPKGFRIHMDDINQIVARHGSRLGLHDPEGSLNKKLTPHCFRHWFTTHLRRNGMPREFIQELRGDRRMDAIDIYDHIDLLELKDRYSECIPGLLDAPIKLHATDLEPLKFNQGVTVSPGQGMRAGPPAGVTVSPDPPVTVSPGQRVRAGPPAGVTVSQVKGVTVSPDQQLPVSPDQQLPVSPDQRLPVSPDQRLPVSPGQQLPVSPDQRLPVSPGQQLPVSQRGKHKHAIYGFTLTLYDYIKKHEGVSVATISRFFLRRKESIKPKLSRLKDYGLIINDGGNWYLTSKKPIAESHFIKVNSTGRPDAVLTEGIA